MNSRLEIKTMALFNFLSMKHKNDKRIGELSFQDILEMVEFLMNGEKTNETY